MDKKVFNEVRAKNDEKYKSSSKLRLMNNIDKRFKTTMIGALSLFEDIFGELWGEKNDNPNEEEKYWRERWEKARTSILNNGNAQLRAALEELDTYTMQWNKYKTNFIVKNN